MIFVQLTQTFQTNDNDVIKLIVKLSQSLSLQDFGF